MFLHLHGWNLRQDMITLLLLDERMIMTENQLEGLNDSPLLATCHPPSLCSWMSDRLQYSGLGADVLKSHENWAT